MDSFIYYKSMKDGVCANQALINELYATHKEFPKADLTYGLFTIDKERKFKLLTFRDGKNGFKNLKNLLHRNKVPELGIFWWKQISSYDNCPFLFQEYNFNIGDSVFFLLGGRINLDNEKSVKKLHQNLNFPTQYSSTEQWNRTGKEVLLNDFIMRKEKVFQNLNVEGCCEFMLFEINKENREAQTLWVGSNSIDLNLSKSKKYLRVAYNYKMPLEKTNQTIGGLGRAVISFEYATDYFDFTDIQLPKYTPVALTEEQFDKIKPCSLSFIRYPVENEDGFGEYCLKAEGKTPIHAHSHSNNTIVIDPKDLGLGFRREAEREEAIDPKEDTIIQVFNVVK